MRIKNVIVDDILGDLVCRGFSFLMCRHYNFIALYNENNILKESDFILANQIIYCLKN